MCDLCALIRKRYNLQEEIIRGLLMKKVLIFALFVLASVRAYSSEEPNLNLFCEIPDIPVAEYFDGGNLLITNLLSENAEGSILDASLMDKAERVGNTLNIGFSNECDNSYTVTLSYKSVEKALADGEVSVKVTVRYFDARLDSGDDNKESVLKLRCTLTRVP